MRSKEEIKNFYKTHLQEEVEILDMLRSGHKKSFTIRAVLVGIAAILFYVSIIIYGHINNLDIKIHLFIGTILMAHFGFQLLKSNLEDTERKIKERVVSPLIRFIDPSFDYKPNEFVSIEDFKASNFYHATSLKTFTGDDLVEGYIGQTQFRFSELSAHRLERSSNNNIREVLIFKGLFFVFDFKKSFDGVLYVLPRRSSKQANYVSRLEETNKTNEALEEVEMESSHFNQLFDVKATNQILARYVLSPKLMETLIKMNENSDHLTMFSFVDGKMYLSISTWENHFSFDMFKKIDEHALLAYCNDLQYAFTIVDEMQLNERLWNK